MEEKKLLRAIVLICLLFSSNVYSSECLEGINFDDQKQSSYNVHSFNTKDAESEVTLRVFVSRSMPINSIKQYFADSGSYNAVLVLNGIPEGSFKKLQDFTSLISENKNMEGNLVIDDAAFEKFKITKVPTIVLSKESDGVLVYDKVTGNIQLKYALEYFSQKGELSIAAKEILENIE